VYEAQGKARLGSPGQAVKLYHVVLDDTARSPRDRALQRASLAKTLVQAGDVDQAVSHGMMVLPGLGTTLTSGRVLQRLQPVRNAASPTAAAEFCDRLDDAARALGAIQRV